MKWRDLYKLVTDRRLAQRRKDISLTKEMMVMLLLKHDAAVDVGAVKPVAATGSDGANGADGSKLREILDPGKQSQDWLSKASKGKKGEDITDQFMDVEIAGHKQKADPAVFEANSMDGIIPSVAVDKFLLAADVLDSKSLLAVLFGKEHKFGKGKSCFKRNVVTTMVCGWCTQLTLEPRPIEFTQHIHLYFY